MHELIAKLTEMLSLTPEQQFRVSAMIKRHVHSEKASVFHRYYMYAQGDRIYDRTDPDNPKLTGYGEPKDKWLHDIMKAKYEQHAEWAKMPDEEVITWSVGSFKYVQKKDPCSVCKCELTGTGKGYMTRYEKGVSTTWCKDCAPKDEE